MEERKLTCIGCLMGCQLQVIIKDGIVEKVTGNTCKRGADYGKKEVTDPTRIVTSTVLFLPLSEFVNTGGTIYQRVL